MSVSHATKLVGASLIMCAAAHACTLPVFRYALDRWFPDEYGLEVPADWQDTEAGKAAGEMLLQRTANLALVATAEPGASPRILMPGYEPVTLWSGEVTEETLNHVTNSPAREELARRILSGQSAVWVMVTGGDETADAALESLLTARLAYLEEVAAIPEQDPNDPESQLGPGPELKVGFSVLVVDRKDPAEQILVRMLAGPEGEELVKDSAPFAAPVFGRGRVLGAWTGSDLDEEGIDEVSLYLLRACTCQVKQQNPGWELLMATDWDTELIAAQMEVDKAGGEDGDVLVTADEPLPELEVVTFGESEEKPVTAPVADSTPSSSSGLKVGLVAAVLVVFGLGGLLWKKAH